jgi:hypothetical protein
VAIGVSTTQRTEVAEISRIDPLHKCLAMCDVFTREDLLRLFRGKSVLFLGDSLMRSIYKDFIWLSKENSLIKHEINKDVSVTAPNWWMWI